MSEAIVPATSPQHIVWARRLCEEYADSLPFALDFQGFAAELADLPGAYSPPAGRLLLALVDGAPVGCVAMHRWSPDTCEMKRLYVRPSHRGRGLGRRLVVAICAAARRAGYRHMVLDTTPSMVEAHALYQALGFVAIAPYRHNPVPGTRYLQLDLGLIGR